ncbi:endonuclease/exonuclease/phosphatase family protein [Sedimentitalea sp. HM32M-2]|uniref:endonuclease/exonuclease/phosphatase family protein n=1 Tax=Sedimentitalea sp. HM32M-2 TaxID=3351566 RepID=UPI003635A5C9
MRLATYNVEWFANLFDDHDRLIVDDGWSGRQGVTRAQQIEALGKVFTALDADGVMIIEAPNTGRRQDTVRALEGFAAAFDLRCNRALIGFANDTHQEIALLYDPKVLTARHDPIGNEVGRKGSTEAPRFDGTFRIDLDIDATEDLVQFSKPPLELAVTTATGTQLRLIGAHLKSKAPHGAANRDAAMRLSIANRRKQLAQAIWLRARIEHHLAEQVPVVLMGDLNDGPGLDEFEHLFGRSSVEILLGDDLYDPHARKALQRRLGAVPTTARFRLHHEKRYLQALLDYIMVSPDLMARRPAWRIWHPFDDTRCWEVEELRHALLTASDHFPVSLDIDI